MHAADESHLCKSQFDTWTFIGLCVLAVMLWQNGWWPFVVPVCLLAGYFGWTKSLLFHDAAHGTMHPRRWINEAAGLLMGTIFLVPLSVYRHAHALHHAYLSTERDPELWPFNRPGTPRVWRLLSAFAEVALGFIYTPLLFLRAVLVAPPPRRIARRIAWEYALTAVFWMGILTVVHRRGAWEAFTVGYLVPVWLAAALQTLNKYVEHLGLTGDSILANTRTVADEREIGRLLSYSMQHVDHHGTHHRYAKIPFYRLPEATPLVYRVGNEVAPVFPSYGSAFFDMLKTMPDPKAGGQWTRGAPSEAVSVK